MGKMSKKAVLSCSFESAQLQQGCFGFKEVQPSEATLQDKVIYVAKNWSFKGKDLESVVIEDETITLASAKQKVVLQGATDLTSFQAFCDAVQGLYDKYHVKPSSSQAKASTHTSAAAKSTYDNNPASWPSTRVRPRRAFGSHARKLVDRAPLYSPPSSPAPDQPRLVPRSQPNRGDPPTNPFTLGDDDDPLMDTDDDDDEKYLKPPLRRRMPDLSLNVVSTEKAMVASPPESTRENVKEEGRSDDDLSFHQDHPMTTPAVSRIVSPGRTVTQAEGTAEELIKQRGQAQIMDYFRSGKGTMAAPALRTPDRPSQHISPAAARIVKSAIKSLKPDEQWASMAESLIKVSSSQKRKEELWGRIPDNNSGDTMDVSEEKEASPPRLSAAVSTQLIRSLKRPRLLPRLHYPSPFRTNLELALASSSSLFPSHPPDAELSVYRGLRNLGNTCYLNSTVQMLCSLPRLVESLKGQSTGKPLTSSLVSIAQQLTDRSTLTSVNPSAIKDAMDERTDRFAGYEQRDAHEFLSELLDGIHEELESSSHGPEIAQEDGKRDLPTDDFLLQVNVALCCTSCGYTRSKLETYRHLSIDIQGNPDCTGGGVNMATVTKSLESFFHPQVLEIKCEKCEAGTQASQTLTVVSRPPCLLLHLKRFIFVEQRLSPSQVAGDENRHPNSPSQHAPVQYVFKKNKSPIAIPEALSLEGFHDPLDSLPLVGAQEYRLRSIVHHIGTRSSSGHYTADCRRKSVSDPLEDCWVTFDDSKSALTDWEHIQSSRFKQETAYLLLYALS